MAVRQVSAVPPAKRDRISAVTGVVAAARGFRRRCCAKMSAATFDTFAQDRLLLVNRLGQRLNHSAITCFQ